MQQAKLAKLKPKVEVVQNPAYHGAFILSLASKNFVLFASTTMIISIVAGSFQAGKKIVNLGTFCCVPIKKSAISFSKCTVVSY